MDPHLVEIPAEQSPTEPMEVEVAPPSSSGKLSVKETTMMLAGQMAGFGTLAFPRALVKTGWSGIPLILAMCIAAEISSQKLGECWNIIEARNPFLARSVRDPYAVIARESFGPWCSLLVSISMMLTLLGGTIIYLWMAAEVMETLMPVLSIRCWYIIMVLIIFPFLLYESPKDLSYIGAAAIFASLGACSFYFTQMLEDGKKYEGYQWKLYSVHDYFVSVGTVMFAFIGTCAFPSIQNDMVERTKFHKSVYRSMIVVFILFIVFSLTAYLTYGDMATPNIAISLTATPITVIGSILVVIQLLSASIITINPVCQQLEEIYNVPIGVIITRIIVRLTIVFIIVLFGGYFSRIYTIFFLFGGTTVSLLTFVMPSLCFMILKSQENNLTNYIDRIRYLSCESILIGIVCGIASTYTAIIDISSTQETP